MITNQIRGNSSAIPVQFQCNSSAVTVQFQCSTQKRQNGINWPQKKNWLQSIPGQFQCNSRAISVQYTKTSKRHSITTTTRNQIRCNSGAIPVRFRCDSGAIPVRFRCNCGVEAHDGDHTGESPAINWLKELGKG